MQERPPAAYLSRLRVDLERCGVNPDFSHQFTYRRLIGGQFGDTASMNEHVDWSAMSDDDFVALLRQLIETPEADED